MSKAEEIAARSAIKEEWFYVPLQSADQVRAALLASINEALEWAAQQCEEHECPTPQEQAMAHKIRAGKSA